MPSGRRRRRVFVVGSFAPQRVDVIRMLDGSSLDCAGATVVVLEVRIGHRRNSFCSAFFFAKDLGGGCHEPMERPQYSGDFAASLSSSLMLVEERKNGCNLKYVKMTRMQPAVCFFHDDLVLQMTAHYSEKRSSPSPA